MNISTHVASRWDEYGPKFGLTPVEISTHVASRWDEYGPKFGLTPVEISTYVASRWDEYGPKFGLTPVEVDSSGTVSDGLKAVTPFCITTSLATSYK